MATNIVLKRSATADAAPSTSDLALGELALNTYDGKLYMKKTVSGTSSIVNLSGGTAATSSAFAHTTYKYTATSSQTTFTGSDANSVTLAYTAGQIQVFLNGILLDAADYTASNGTSVVLGSGASTGSILLITSFEGTNPFDYFKYTATNAQTTFTGNDANSESLIYTVGNIAVYLNGVLLDATDYTSTSGTSVVLASGATTGDILTIWEFNEGALTDVANDTSPQLGADLDVVTYDIVSTSNRNIDIVPNGTGNVTLQTDTLQLGSSGENVTVTTNGTGDVTLNTNSGTNSGSIVIADGANANITVTPNGTGIVSLVGDVTIADGSNDFDIASHDGTNGLKLAGTVVTTTAAELNIVDGSTSATGTTLAAGDRLLVNDNGTMVQVALSDFETFFESAIDTFSTIDINGGSIDGTTVGANSASTGAFTTLSASGALTGTLGTAAQTNITSLGTLTALTVDDINLNGKVVTMTGSTDDTAVFTAGTNGTLSIVTVDTAAAAANIQITADGTVDIDSAGVLTLDSGAAINIEPASGSAILLDGTISIDAGVVTNASSITSTAFVGALTGNATTATALASARTIGGVSFDGSANIAVTLAATATALANARTIGGTSFDGTGNIAVATATEATNITAVANNSTNETVYPAFVDGATGTQGIETDTGLTYNPSSGTLTSTVFVGALTGNASGTALTVTQAAQTAITSVGTLSSLALAGDLTGVSNLYIADDIGHTGDGDTYLSWDTNNLSIYNGGVQSMYMNASEVVVNEASGDVDFRVESNGNANMLFVDGGTDNVGIGTTPADAGSTTRLHIADAASTAILQLTGAGVGTAATDGFHVAADDNGDGYLRNYENGNMFFYTNATNKMTITALGQVKAAKSAMVTEVALTDGSTAVDASIQQNCTLVLQENTTIGQPSNAVAGQVLTFEIAQHASSGPYTLAWHTDFEFAASTAPTMTATDAKTDIFTFRYNGSVWQEIGRSQNMAQS